MGGGQIYPISPKLIINSKWKPFLNKKSIGGRCPTLIGCTSATVRKVVWFTGKMKFIFCFILNKRWNGILHLFPLWYDHKTPKKKKIPQILCTFFFLSTILCTILNLKNKIKSNQKTTMELSLSCSKNWSNGA